MNLLNDGPTPRNGNKSDQAHPPIHPTKYTNNLQVNARDLGTSVNFCYSNREKSVWSTHVL